MIDSYLVHGMPCKCYYNSGKEILMYFSGYIGCLPLFVSDIENVGGMCGKRPIGDHFRDYRPIVTEWALAPGCALDPKNKNACSTVDADGTIQIFWSNDKDLSIDKLKTKNGKWMHSGFANHITVGTCKDPERVKNWKDSMRMRPVWAEVTR